MNRAEAQRVIGAVLDELRDMSYDELVETFLDDPHAREIEGPDSGTLYRVEIEAFWDDREGENLRVLVAVDDGNGLRGYVPVTEDFTIAPNGLFVGE
ncbi:MAG: hypothetical protein ABR548_06660 [Actinomycetota bacterium]|nr:hypothetical protein [Actinomycetota bacterium]